MSTIFKFAVALCAVAFCWPFITAILVIAAQFVMGAGAFLLVIGGVAFVLYKLFYKPGNPTNMDGDGV